MLLIRVWFITMLQMDSVVDELLQYNPHCWGEVRGKCAVVLAVKRGIQFRDIVVRLACNDHELLKSHALWVMRKHFIDDDTVSDVL